MRYRPLVPHAGNPIPSALSFGATWQVWLPTELKTLCARPVVDKEAAAKRGGAKPAKPHTFGDEILRHVQEAAALDASLYGIVSGSLGGGQGGSPSVPGPNLGYAGYAAIYGTPPALGRSVSG